MPDLPPPLDAGDRRFPSISKEMILANKGFQFIVTGEPAIVLGEFIVDGKLVDAYKMPERHRLLRPVMGAALLAEGMGRTVRFTHEGNDIIGTVSGQ